MSEFDANLESPSPAAKINARMKFERYVFVAFFAVISMLTVAGLIQFQRSQQALLESRSETQDAQSSLRSAQARLAAEQAISRSTQREIEQDLATAKERETRRSRDLGTALVQLAMLEANKGPAASARGAALLEDALRYGAPPYLALARWALLDSSRVAIPDFGKETFNTAAASPDGRWLAISRGERGIELYGPSAATKPLLLGVPASAGEATALTLSNDALFAGFGRGAIVRFALGNSDGLAPLGAVVARMRNRIKLIALSEAGLRLATLDFDGNLRVAQAANADMALFEVGDPSLVAVAALDSLESLAVAMNGDGRLFMFSLTGKVASLEGLGGAPVMMAALRVIGDELFMARSTADNLQYRRQRLLASEELKPTPTQSAQGGATFLAFANDGTLLVGHPKGRVREYDFGTEAGITYVLGDDADLHFIARWRGATFGLSAENTASLRHDPISLNEGQSVYLLQANDTLHVTSQGFALPARGLAWPRERGLWLETGQCERLLATSRGYVASSSGVARFSPGVIVPNAGALLCVFASGAGLFKGPEGKLCYVTQDGQQTPLEATGNLVPDLTIAAASAEAALVRAALGPTELFSFIAGAKSGRQGLPLGPSSTGMLAIDASAKSVAVIEIGLVRVLTLRSDVADLRIAVHVAPSHIALLFGGTILCALMGGELVFFETETGRELLRRQTAATGFAASDDELFLVCPDRLRVLRFK